MQRFTFNFSERLESSNSGGKQKTYDPPTSHPTGHQGQDIEGF
jgi:hypothetical protein